jgi:PBP1b-binding outer membrane lipoprotein LpoB
VNKWKKIFLMLMVLAIFFSGCSMRTVEEMYRIPKRSKEYNNLQAVIDSAMSGLIYSAPLAGENRQTIQMADLDGDGVQEYLLFAKSKDSAESPLKILVFTKEKDTFIHKSTISSNGAAFDQVEYVQMNNQPGVEIVVGTQVSDQVIRSAAIYTYGNNGAEQIVSVNYSKFLVSDLDGDTYSELFVLRPGADQQHGVAELYGVEKGAVERTNEVNMSQGTEKLKRIVLGKLQTGEPAVYVASAVDETTIVTDVFALVNKKLTNVTLSNESGTSVKTLRNYYVYADDIDNDGILELPALVNVKEEGNVTATERQHLIRWYALTPNGEEIDKLYTFHNFVGGWYLQLNDKIAPQLTITATGFQYEFRLWDAEYKTTEKLLTIYACIGQNREDQALLDNRFVVYRTETTTFAAKLEPIAAEYNLTQDSVIYSFRLIQLDWKTGET